MPIDRSSPRILLIDDDDVDREFCARVLRRFDIAQRVDECDSADAARQLMHDNKYDCVVLDQNLGDGLGLDLLPEIKAHREEICSVILVTLDGSDDLIVDAMRRGVSDYITKSHLDSDTLRRVITAAIQLAREQQARHDASEKFAAMAEMLRSDHERSLRHALAKAEGAHLAKSLFVANMSHEIRTPLNAVIGLCYLLQHTTLSDHQNDLVGKIKVASKALLSIVNNVLDLSKMEAGAARPESAPFRLDELVADIAKLAEVQIGDRPIAFAVDFAGDVRSAFSGDAARIHQILLNLVTNAIKFTEEGSIRIGVRALARSENVDLVRFSVTDTGIGITKEVLAGLFQPFVQADASTSRRYGGTGLGLSIARQAAELMGGRIGATSNLGEGSEFWFELPLEPCAVADIKSAAEPTGSTGERLAGINVLLVDDSSINLDVASHILAIEGARVDTAVNGQDALKLILGGASRYDIVLMDLQMPVMNGYDAFRAITAILGNARPRVLALTAGAVDEVASEAAFPMDGLVTKPFDIDGLIGTILSTIHQGEAAAVERDAAAQPDNGSGSAPSLPRSDRRPDQKDASPAWPDLPGVDVTDAMARLPGDYLGLLGNLKRMLGEREAMTADGDRTHMLRSMHRLKGNAGLLGARTVQHLAETVEGALRGGPDGNVEVPMNALRGEMARLDARIGELLRPD